ncbi:MAG: Ferrochelatase [Phycisphaerae bacterium]|nr:Ferrochelatase [Phycisphaerae bacterium]
MYNLPLASASVASPMRDEFYQTATCRKGVLLLNVGTPSGCDPESVRRYLAEFLSDPHVIKLPRGLGWMNPLLGHLIAFFRSKKSAALYRNIWTPEGSPLMTISQRQAAQLENMLPPGWRVFLAMRYGQPSIRDVVKQIRNAGITELVVVPMYPHYSGPTTHTALEAFYREAPEAGLDASIIVRTAWYDDAAYIAAQAKVINDFMQERNLTPQNSFLLFSTHSMPKSYITHGDPYLRHIASSVVLLSRKLEWPAGRKAIGFQSKLGPVPWLSPSTDEMLTRLAQRGEKKVIICPISFTADCLETLEEIGMRSRELFTHLGGELHLCPALNDHEAFMVALRNLVLRGPQHLPLSLGARMQIETPPASQIEPARLFMFGVSVPNRIGCGHGPKLQYEDAETLRSIKLSSEETTAFLHNLRQDGLFDEVFVWNTCNRFECYGWIKQAHQQSDHEAVLFQTLQRIFGQHDLQELSFNVLRDRDAVHHILRTSCGLNSELPGEKDIAQQLLAALRVARSAGTSGPLTETLLTKVTLNEHELREHTDWGRFSPSYCSALLNQLDQSARAWRDHPITIIGRSTTAMSMLQLLIEELKIPTQQITFIHKGSRRDGQIKQMRRLVTDGRKIRVDSYADPLVARIVAESGLTVYCIDTPQPVLDGRQLRPMLNLCPAQRLIVDFNTFGSTMNLEEVPEVQLWDARRVQQEVTRSADQMCLSTHFWETADYIEQRLRVQAANLAELYHMRHEAQRPATLSISAAPRILSPVMGGGN